MKDLFDVSGKVALVTGGSRGIGEMIAEGFVTNGVKTYISARKADACDATASRLSKMGECISIPVVVRSRDGGRMLRAVHGCHRRPQQEENTGGICLAAILRRIGLR